MLPLSNILDKINPLEKNQSSVEFCLGLVISERKVKSAIWNLGGAGSEEITFGSTESWSNDSAEELVVAADASIATAVTKLPHLDGQQPTKVILGLPEHWVEGNNVEKKRGIILQALCKKLLLKSLGFVVTPEAIAHYLKKEEGGLPNIILLNLGETEMVVSLINQGKFVGSKVVGRSDSVALDLEEGLLRFNYQGVLPNRIFLIEDAEIGEIEELRQALVAYPWVGPENGKKLNFLQFPKVEIALDGFEVKAVMIAGKHELGLAAEKVEATLQETAPASEVAAKEETVEAKVETPAVVKEESAEKLEEEVSREKREESLSGGDFGFVKGEDILLTGVVEAMANESPSPPGTFASPEETVPAESEMSLPEAPFPQSSRLSALAAIFSLPKKAFGRLKVPQSGTGLHLPTPRLAFSFASHRALVLLGASLIFVLGMVFFGFWRFARAQVKIFVQPQRVDKEFEFSVSDEVGAVDSEKMIVPASEITTEISGSKAAEVKGKKTVGDKAKGEVTIYNGDTKVVIFAKGAVIKGPSGTKFVLDQEVKIASASVDWAANPPQAKLGEGKVTVTAADIGTQYNVANNSEFSPEKGLFSNLKIKNTTAFSGGASREIQAVSREDRENLQKALLAELEAKAKEELLAKLGENDHPLTGTILLKNKTDRFNHEVGDEVTSLTLEEKAVFALAYIKDENFRILADKAVAGLVPSGYQKEPLKEERSSAVKDKVKGIYTARVKEEFLPEMAVEKIPVELKGKTFSKGENYLKSLSQSIGLEVTVKPRFFAFFRIFPLREQNINVTIETL